MNEDYLAYLKLEEELSDVDVSAEDLKSFKEAMSKGIVTLGKKGLAASKAMMTATVSLFDELSGMELEFKRIVNESKKKGDGGGGFISFDGKGYLVAKSDNPEDLKGTITEFDKSLPSVNQVSSIIREVNRFSTNAFKEFTGLKTLKDLSKSQIDESLEAMHKAIYVEVKKGLNLSEDNEPDGSEVAFLGDINPGRWQIKISFNKDKALVGATAVDAENKDSSITAPKTLSKADIESIANVGIVLCRSLKGLRKASTMLNGAAIDLNKNNEKVIGDSRLDASIISAYGAYSQKASTAIGWQRQIYMTYLYKGAEHIQQVINYLKISMHKLPEKEEA